MHLLASEGHNLPMCKADWFHLGSGWALVFSAICFTLSLYFGEGGASASLATTGDATSQPVPAAVFAWSAVALVALGLILHSLYTYFLPHQKTPGFRWRSLATAAVLLGGCLVSVGWAVDAQAAASDHGRDKSTIEGLYLGGVGVLGVGVIVSAAATLHETKPMPLKKTSPA